MREHLKDARIKAAQIRETDNQRDGLLRRLNEVRKRIDADARPSTVETILTDFRELDRELSIAREQRTQRQQLQQQTSEKMAELERASSQQHEAEAKLAAMAMEAGVADPTELPEAIERSRRRS